MTDIEMVRDAFRDMLLRASSDVLRAIWAYENARGDLDMARLAYQEALERDQHLSLQRELPL